jgi:hypothetical protein
VLVRRRGMSRCVSRAALVRRVGRRVRDDMDVSDNVVDVVVSLLKISRWR